MLKLKISQTAPNPLQINLECAAGQLHALVGPSGSGKTNTLRAIAGLSLAKVGKIECDGKVWFEANEISGAYTDLPPAERSCGFLFQQYALFPHLSAIENVAIPLHNSAITAAERKKKRSRAVRSHGNSRACKSHAAPTFWRPTATCCACTCISKKSENLITG